MPRGFAKWLSAHYILSVLMREVSLLCKLLIYWNHQYLQPLITLPEAIPLCTLQYMNIWICICIYIYICTQVCRVFSWRDSIWYLLLSAISIGVCSLALVPYLPQCPWINTDQQVWLRWYQTKHKGRLWTMGVSPKTGTTVSDSI